MKNLLFYTFHRQFEEIYYSSLFFNRSNFLKTNFDVILHCNNFKRSHTEINSVSKFNTNVHTIITSKNCGYNFGHFEALSDNFNLFKNYNMIIHMHPDCYIVNDQYIKQLNELDFDIAASPIDHIDRLCFCTDFFVFKSKYNFADTWQDAWKSNNQGVPEHYFFDTITKSNLKLITAQRFPNNKGSGFRAIDQYGLWHEHDNYKVKNYLQDQELI